MTERLYGKDFWEAEMNTALINQRVCDVLTQTVSERATARRLRETDGTVSKYSDGVSEQLTPQMPLATEEQTARQLGSQLRQKGAE
jgi:hypothetical protein